VKVGWSLWDVRFEVEEIGVFGHDRSCRQFKGKVGVWVGVEEFAEGRGSLTWFCDKKCG
jgi:hypothetical protein